MSVVNPSENKDAKHASFFPAKKTTMLPPNTFQDKVRQAKK